MTVTAAALVFAPRPPLLEGMDFSSAVYDRNHRLLRLTLTADDKYRLRLPLKEISPLLRETTLRHEDRHFLSHPGVNPGALLRAVWHSLIKRDRRLGASTLTMQVARMRYELNTRTPAGKLWQILCAIQLERHYSKAEILEAYLNLVPYGGNVEGAGAASLIYFQKDAGALNLVESLTLSVIPQSPARRGPKEMTADARSRGITLDASSEALRRARRILFDEWRSVHPADAALAARLDLPLRMHHSDELPFAAPHFVDGLNLPPGGGALVTTLDPELQRLLETRLRSAMESRRREGITNAVALLVETRTLAVRAAVGSADYFNADIAGQVNGLTARRSPGSALKPFVYALAFDAGLIHPLSLLNDAPASYGGYDPENFDGEFTGPISAHDALVHSRNLPAVQLAAQLGKPGLHGLLQRAGVGRLYKPEHYGLAIVLGGAEVTPEELAALYATLGNEGQYKPLRRLREEKAADAVRLLSPEAATLTLNTLRDNPRPGQRMPDGLERVTESVAWKTGTSQGFHDAWSAGLAGPYTLVVWVGNFDHRSNPAFIGRDAAGPLFFAIVDALNARPEMRRRPSPPPAGLARVEVCALSGMLPGPECPHRVSTLFIPGVSPIKVCNIHRRVAIDPATGRRACPGHELGLPASVYEFWPSDMLKLFRAAGLPRRTPPPENLDCLLGGGGSSGLPPRITSPQNALTYTLRSGSAEPEKIPLLAVTDADSRTVHWFLDAEYLGVARAGQPYFWTARAGHFRLRVVDDEGRADAREFNVETVQ